jgi:hypothetical protein
VHAAAGAVSPRVNVTRSLASPVTITASPRQGTVTASGSPITHGFQITAANTGHLAFFDPGLGRPLVDGDLTVHADQVSLSGLGVANGATVSRRWFQGGVTIDRTNVTFNGCKFKGSVTCPESGGTVTTFNYCTLYNDSGFSDEALRYVGYNANRCNISGSSDGIRTNGRNTAIECYIRCKGVNSDDHNDGTQSHQGDGFVTVQRCNIDCRPTNGVGQANAALFCADGSVGQHNWHDNVLAGGGYVIRAYEFGPLDIQGNWVLDGSWVFQPADIAGPPHTVVWGTVRPNLIIDAAGNQLSVLASP